MTVTNSRVLFLIPQSPYCEETNLGPLYVAAAVRQAGHTIYIHYLDLRRLLPRRYGRYRWVLADVMRICRRVQPQIVALSVMSTNAELMLAVARTVKSVCDARVIIGGMHAMIAGDELFSEPAVDAVCHGEGELALCQYLVAAADGGMVTGLSYRRAPEVIVRGAAPTAYPALTAYPEPARDVLISLYRRGKMRAANFITGRGCPYHCTYCNAPMMNAGGRYVRFREADEVVEEIVRFRERSGLAEVIFSDETFTLRHDRLSELLESYRRRVGLPFICQTRVETVTAEVARRLANAGCRLVTIGIESGNAAIREKWLQRKMSDEQIIDAVGHLRTAGITVGSFNMVGLPDETEATIRETVELNRRAGIMQPCCTVFMPFRRTQLHDYYQTRGMIAAEPDLDYYHQVTIRHPYLTRAQLLFYAHNFARMVRFGWRSYPDSWLCWITRLRQTYAIGLRLLKQAKLLAIDISSRGEEIRG